MSTSAFSSAETVVLEREVESSEDQVELSDIWSEKQLENCAQWILSNKFSKVNKLSL